MVNTALQTTISFPPSENLNSETMYVTAKIKKTAGKTAYFVLVDIPA